MPRGGLEDLFGTLFGAGEQITCINGMVVTNCPACGTPFAVEATLWRNVKRTGQRFYCPNGHPQGFGESDADKLRKQLAEETRRREQVETQLRKAQATGKEGNR